MRATILRALRCDACGADGAGALRLDGRSWHGDVLVEGQLACRCGATWPVRGSVLDLRDRTPVAVLEDGAWWSKFFREQARAGLTGFADLDDPVAPCLHLGLAEPLPSSERASHFEAMIGSLANGGGGLALDVGAGAGWASTFLARRGFRVLAVDPAWDAACLGQRAALERGLAVDYVCGGIAQLPLAPGALDLVVSCHALHHVPDLDAAVSGLFESLKVGGHVFVDDHHSTHPALAANYGRLEEWARREVLPRCRSWPTDGFATGAPAHEDASAGRVLPALLAHFEPLRTQTRPVMLDALPFLMYLKRGRCLESYRVAQDLVGSLGGILAEAFPWSVEYVTFAGRRGHRRAALAPGEPTDAARVTRGPGGWSWPSPEGAPPAPLPLHLRRLDDLVSLQRELVRALAFKIRRRLARLMSPSGASDSAEKTNAGTMAPPAQRSE
jgi:2-polyprenyl-3-methyl-5-hydroxy-6-metoxy-1,4-benzoquinol methylase